LRKLRKKEERRPQRIYDGKKRHNCDRGRLGVHTSFKGESKVFPGGNRIGGEKNGQREKKVAFKKKKALPWVGS